MHFSGKVKTINPRCRGRPADALVHEAEGIVATLHVSDHKQQSLKLPKAECNSASGRSRHQGVIF